MKHAVEIQDDGQHKFCARALIKDEAGNYLGEVTWVQGYSFLDEAELKTSRIATAYRFAASDELLEQLRKAESFISGFESDQMQEGIDELLAGIREAISLAKPPAN